MEICSPRNCCTRYDLPHRPVANDSQTHVPDLCPCIEENVDPFFRAQSSNKERVSPAALADSGVWMNEVRLHDNLLLRQAPLDELRPPELGERDKNVHYVVPCPRERVGANHGRNCGTR